MVGLIRRVTPNYSLQIPNYDIAGWGVAMNKNFDILDASLFAVTGYGNIRGEWMNSTLYNAADRVVDTVTGGIWQAIATHTSAASGTFAADRAANPGRWTQLVGSVSYRGLWTTATAYNSNEFMYFDHQYAVGTKYFVSGATFAADVAAGNILVLIDLRAEWAAGQQAVTSAAEALASKNAAAASAAAALASQNAAATSATNAANSATASQTSAVNSANSATASSNSAAAALASQNAAAASATAANNSALAAAASALAAQLWDPTFYYNKVASDARFVHLTGSETIGGPKTFTSALTISYANAAIEHGLVGTANTPFIDWHSAAFANDYDVRVVASGGFNGSGGGTLNVIGALFQHNGNNLWHTGTFNPATKADVAGQIFTGNVTSPAFTASLRNIVIASPDANNIHLWYQEAGVARTVAFYEPTTDRYAVQVNNSAGAATAWWYLYENRHALWTGHTITVGSAVSENVSIAFHPATNLYWRWVANNAGAMYLQKANNPNFTGTSDVIVATATQVVMNTEVYGTGFFFNNPTYGAFRMVNGNGDAATINTFNHYIAGWNGIGFFDLSSGVNRITMDLRQGRILTTGRVVVGTGGSFIDTDGNIGFTSGMAGFGTTLYDGLNGRRPNVTGIWDIGNVIMVKTTGASYAPGNNMAAATLVLSNSGAAVGIAVSGGTWRCDAAAITSTNAGIALRIA